MRISVSTIISFVLFFLTFWLILPESIRFAENWHTFYWNNDYISECISSEGIDRVVSDFFTQFFATRCSAAFFLSVISSIVFFIILSLVSRKSSRKMFVIWSSVTVAVIVAVVAVYIFTNKAYKGLEGRFRSQMCLARDGRWDEIVAQSKGRRVTNLLEQNLLNMSLAEQCMLDEYLMDQPCRDILSIYVQEFESPYIAAMLSDIYWSMGHVAFSQTYAFQANEKLDNLSPRLLQRLAQTAIVFGQYELAERYLWWLDQTLFYKGWSRRHRALLSDEAVERDPYYSSKRSCIIEEDRFSGSRGLDEDLRCIVAQNPEHKATGQFLNALVKLYYGK